jgi:hypothetical protein
MSHVNYFDAAEVVADKIPEVTKPADVTAITRLCLAVSAFIDNYCRRPAGYFQKLPSPTPPKTVKRYRGTGSRFLQIGRHVAGSVELTNPAIAADRFYEGENGWLYAAEVDHGIQDEYFAIDDRLFRDGALYQVTAHWYFAETPPDVVEAGKQIIADIWSKGRGVVGDVAPDGFVVDRAIPTTAAALLKPYIKREFERE